MNISSYAQETMCYVGQLLVFEQAADLLNELTCSNFNAKQIERICHQYGSWIEQQDQAEYQQTPYVSYSASEQEQLHYVGLDGSMYLTREQGWKEVKLCRIYKHQSIHQLSPKRSVIRGSSYVGNLGKHTDFLPKVEHQIENLKHIAFICDGAQWIWNWIEDNYPDRIQILDYYHAKEHLCDFAKIYIKQEKRRNDWISQQCELMLDKGVDPVLEQLENLAIKGSKVQEAYTNLLNYYKRNQARMQYHKFREAGLQIGSGAIEAAHRNVLQQRLKLSGQRWTIAGLQQMVELRTLYKSGNQHRITQIAKMAA